MKVAIIEDELPAARHLQRLLTQIDPGIEVVEHGIHPLADRGVAAVVGVEPGGALIGREIGRALEQALDAIERVVGHHAFRAPGVAKARHGNLTILRAPCAASSG